MTTAFKEVHSRVCDKYQRALGFLHNLFIWVIIGLLRRLILLHFLEGVRDASLIANESTPMLLNTLLYTYSIQYLGY